VNHHNSETHFDPMHIYLLSSSSPREFRASDRKGSADFGSVNACAHLFAERVQLCTHSS
jgi:hypothetical protein